VILYAPVPEKAVGRHRERLGDVAWCPTQFQQYIPGVDHRGHLVRESVFACEIRSASGDVAFDDYRYASRDGVTITIHASTLPDEVAERCRMLTSDLGLSLSGIDLRLTPAGEWYCFEVNPSSAFTYYQEATGHPIAALLIVTPNEPHPPHPK
jgi:glutathione synthase/RimK-type ligase-like ATP-grasp enzyme